MPSEGAVIFTMFSKALGMVTSLVHILRCAISRSVMFPHEDSAHSCHLARHTLHPIITLPVKSLISVHWSKDPTLNETTPESLYNCYPLLHFPPLNTLRLPKYFIVFIIFSWPWYIIIDGVVACSPSLQTKLHEDRDIPGHFIYSIRR